MSTSTVYRIIPSSYRHRGRHRRRSSPARILVGAFLGAIWLLAATGGVVTLIGAPR